MADIIIARLQFPNDPTKNLVAHQMYVAEQTGTHINLYSVSSIFGKEKRVYGPNRNHYLTILSPEHSTNCFKTPSFIDCTKMYQISISDSVDLSKLKQRNVSDALKTRIDAKIAEMKAQGTHIVYPIKEEDFCSWNPVVVTL